MLDYRALTDQWLPIVFAFVLALSFVLLTVAFRSVVLPAVAIGLNLLSVGAAYGLIVLVFLDDVGRDLLGFTEVDVIAAWLPLFLFAVLFGLSMDYTVFLLSRIRERVSSGDETVEAVAWSVASTARIITGAALIIIAVFVGFAAGDQVEFQQMGFGIAVSLLIDATVVRLVLLPAVLALLRERTWYLPRWLDWLPHLEIEGAGEPRGPALISRDPTGSPAAARSPVTTAPFRYPGSRSWCARRRSARCPPDAARCPQRPCTARPCSTSTTRASLVAPARSRSRRGRSTAT